MTELTTPDQLAELLEDAWPYVKRYGKSLPYHHESNRLERKIREALAARDLQADHQRSDHDGHLRG